MPRSAGSLRRHSPAAPKIGIAFGGGGARGLAHIGVLQAFQELHIPLDYVAGTSMGAIIGGLYACGSTTDGMEQLTRDIKWATIFQDAPERPEQRSGPRRTISIISFRSRPV